jgi:hypothetical protein
MIKRVLLTLMQFLAFCFLMAIGGYWDIIHLLIQIKAPALSFIPLLKFHVSATHDFVADGLLFASILFLLILILEAARKTLKPWAALTTLAFAAAVILCLAMKLGLPPVASPASDSALHLYPSAQSA